MGSPEADIRRRAHQVASAKIGVTDDYIDELVETFYVRIRAHEILGPIFADVVQNNWEPHLAKMKLFWSSVALSTGVYKGQPVPAHVKISGLTETHFDIWLGLFEQTLKDTAPTPELVDYFMKRANRIAQSLRLALFGIPGLEKPQYPVHN